MTPGSVLALFPILPILPILPVAGCSVQLASGYAARAPDAAPRVVQLEAQIEDMRKNGPILGVRGVAAVKSRKEPLAVRSAMVHGGYQLRPRWPYPGFEAGLDLGLGAPAFFEFSGIGGYLGTRATVLYRVMGEADTDVSAYYTSTILMDLVVGGFSGVWTAPASGTAQSVVGDAGGFLGLRVGIGTDVARAPIEKAER